MELGLEVAPPHPRETLARLGSEFGVPPAVRKRAIELLGELNAVKAGTGCNPAGIAAGCLYLTACEFECSLTQREIATAAEISVVTLRARMEDLIDLRE
ncbi:hypothetical protein [Halobaculum limi]|uniref:hypothetical protein n=1 Tax=Halobaculum limi TaxID=3031916 RepID=UPI003D80B436